MSHLSQSVAHLPGEMAYSQKWRPQRETKGRHLPQELTFWEEVPSAPRIILLGQTEWLCGTMSHKNGGLRLTKVLGRHLPWERTCQEAPSALPIILRPGQMATHRDGGLAPWSW
jgi:hypothetical protein